MADILTISKAGVYNIYFEKGGAILNAGKSEKWKSFVEANKDKAIDLDEYLDSIRETIQEGGNDGD